jgi:colanic acid biosynthesis glycosyl transferase WcaI
MRILFVGINYWPEPTGIAPFNAGRCEFLAALGHQVTVITAMPHYPRWRIEEQYRGRLFVREQRNGVALVRCPLYVPRRATALKRVLHEASFVAAALARSLIRARPEVMVITSPPLSLSVAGIILSRWWHTPYVFHVEDIQPDAALDLGMLPPAGRLARTLFALARAAYRNAALISTLTESMRRNIISRGVPPERVFVSPGWAEPAFFGIPATGGGERFRRRFDCEDRFVAMHAGNMGVKQGLEVILGAADRTRANAQILYLLVGDGAMRESLQARARAMTLPNVRFLPLQPTEIFYELLAAADLGLLTQRKTVADIVFPSKLLSLLAAARPVVASVDADGEAARVIKESGAGLVVAAEDPGALADAVSALCRDHARRRLMGERARVCARTHWHREQILPAMETRLRQLVSARGAAQTHHPASARLRFWAGMSRDRES